jgi:hypothetical protein
VFFFSWNFQLHPIRLQRCAAARGPTVEKEINPSMDLPDIQTIIHKNAAEHERLAELAAGLTEQELSRTLDSGWTVAGILAHLAFWDARAILLIEKWKREGVGPSPADIDIINDSAKALCLAVAPRRSAELAVEKSLEINRAVENLSPDMAERIRKTGTAVHLTRFEHKRVHLDEIGRVLGKK